MRIGIGLRSINYLGGIATYTQQIVDHLLRIGGDHEYVLLYPAFDNAREIHGRYAGREGVTEVLSESAIPIGHYWDHVVVPREARRYGLDVYFNPFLSVPLLGRMNGTKTVFVLHGCEWYTMPEVFWPTERLFGRARMTAIVKASDLVISVSRAVAREVVKATGFPEEKFRIVHNAANAGFTPIDDPERLRAVREKYDLPAEFMLFVGGLYPQKNFSRLLTALDAVRDRIPHHLVAAGDMRWRTRPDIERMRELGLEDRVHLIGWVEHEDLAALYNLATGFVLPSFFESCSVALLEAIATGCPVIAASTGGNPEVTGDAAVYVDPYDVDDIAGALLRVGTDAGLRATLRAAGLERSKAFGWEKAARQTLAVIEELG